MKRKVLAIALSLAILTSLFVFAAPVSAEPGQSFDFLLSMSDGTTPDTRYAGNSENYFVQRTLTYTVTGVLEGTVVFDISLVRHWGNLDNENAQNSNGILKGIFTGTFNGSEEGTAMMTNIFQGFPIFEGPGTIEGLTDGLLGFHATFYAVALDFWHSDASGTYHWDSRK